MDDREKIENQPLDKLAELFWTQNVITGITWDDCVALALKVYDAGYRKVEPVELEALGDEEILAAKKSINPIFVGESHIYDWDIRIVQQTINHNRDKFGQLYRVKE